MHRPAELVLGALLLAACASPRPQTPTDTRSQQPTAPAQETKTKERENPTRPEQPAAVGAVVPAMAWPEGSQVSNLNNDWQTGVLLGTARCCVRFGQVAA